MLRAQAAAGSRLPTLDEAKDRLDLSRSRGPSPRAFTFKDAYPPEGVADA